MDDRQYPVIYPERAAAGGLNLVPVSEWPMLAAHWLAAGFDSEPLRQLAGLGSRETEAARELMPGVLRSIGCELVDVEAEFAARCQAALDIVQRDLDVTGYGEYQMRPVNLALEAPVVMYAALPDGRSWSGIGEGMTSRMDDASLLWCAAATVSGTLGEVLRIGWPVCAVHGGQPMTPPSVCGVPGGLTDGAVWWWCSAGAGHVIARVGQLTAKIAKTR